MQVMTKAQMNSIVMSGMRLPMRSIHPRMPPTSCFGGGDFGSSFVITIPPDCGLHLIV